MNINIDKFQIINESDQKIVPMKEVKLVNGGFCELFMKDIMKEKYFLKRILDKEERLRIVAVLSHDAVFEVKGILQLLFMADGGFVIDPTLSKKFI